MNTGPFRQTRFFYHLRTDSRGPCVQRRAYLPRPENYFNVTCVSIVVLGEGPMRVTRPRESASGSGARPAVRVRVMAGVRPRAEAPPRSQSVHPGVGRGAKGMFLNPAARGGKRHGTLHAGPFRCPACVGRRLSYPPSF